MNELRWLSCVTTPNNDVRMISDGIRNTHAGMQEDAMSGCATRQKGKNGAEETKMKGEKKE
uniref:Uncharacterized protein n=1 Tax=Hyaloperonospora arabidopsidis (strain Emoy2) TaxID=559515 RepID=M4BZU7_HYAAE